MAGQKKAQEKPLIERRKMARYLSPADVWAIAFGCSVGWGAFVMPATTFLPLAGPAGTLIAMLLSTALMLVIGYNYAWLMRHRPCKGGIYNYTKEAFGRDHAFLASWFLSLSYLTIVFLNATALFIITRVVFAESPGIGFQYRIGDHIIYPGEIALSIFVLVLVGLLLIWKKEFMQMAQRILAFVLLAGVLILTFAAAPCFDWHVLLHSYGSGGVRSAASIMMIVLLAPWAFVGFEIASLETPHFDFPVHRSGAVMTIAILSAGFAYTAMSFISASFRPAGYDSWQVYLSDLDRLPGVSGVPTFFAARTVLGPAGIVIITVTALAAILTGVIGAYRATVRMLSTMAEDRILAREFNGTTFSIIFIMAVSSLFTFLGRNTLNWFVELTSFGATIGFAYTSAAAARIAAREGNSYVRVTGFLGAALSGIFALVHLASRIGSLETMGAPSFLMLAVWCLLGFIFYWRTMRQSKLTDFEGITTSSAVLFGLLFYSVLMWFIKRILEAAEDIHAVQGADGGLPRILHEAVLKNGAVVMVFVLVGLLVMLFTQGWLRRRQSVLEREKIHAEESSKAKSQFLFNMSHDIRTPMNAIIGYTHLAALEEDVPPKVRDYISKIDISGRHLLTLINDILEMSQIESGKMELDNAPGNICEALQTAYEMFQEQMEEKGIAYSLQIREVPDPYVLFDRNRFLRVVLNLVSNACKFTPEGGSVAVSLSQIGRRDTEGAYELRVKDTGIGMTQEFAEIVFEAFARERTSTVSRIQGTGLGMAITKSIVDAMQGTIDLITAPGEGTEFIIRVPYPLSDEQAGSVEKTASEKKTVSAEKTASVEKTASAKRTASAKKTASAEKTVSAKETVSVERTAEGTGAADRDKTSSKRLLVAEDMEINRQIVEMLLQNLGYEVDTVENGREAVDRISTSVPGFYDAVLMDIQMPVMDGYEAAESIRRLPDPALAGIPIIAVTANAFGEDVRRAQAAGMDAHISKPIDPEQLSRTLEEILGRGLQQN